MAELRARRIYSDPARTIVAVESVELVAHRTSGRFQLFGRAEPSAIVVAGGDGSYALDMQCEPVDLDRLRREVPELDAMIMR